MGRIRVLVVDDSITVRKQLVQVLSADAELEVAGEAGDGRAAVELCESLRPQVVTLDMMLPVMSGLAATEHIMAYRPTPIVIVSSSTNRDDVFKTYEALAAGAVEVLEKPAGDEEGWEEKLTATVKLASRIKVITHPRARLAPPARPAAAPPPARRGRAPCRLVALGASTGGPAALRQVLPGLPAEFPVPVLAVVHLAPAFAAAFAEWLDTLSPLRVRYARDGEPLPETGQGQVLLAPPDRHLVVRGGRLRLSGEPERHSCRPSVDVLFESVARELGQESAACLLTGMGRDGAQGLLAIRRAGGTTFAQDEETSVVFGMPREAVLLGAAEHVLPLEQLAPALTALCGGGEARRRS